MQTNQIRNIKKWRQKMSWRQKWRQKNVAETEVETKNVAATKFLNDATPQHTAIVLGIAWDEQ